uniref:Uncharacterized protein n=1 Tax=Kalanchoe fedtschenkoi TaxID=63787 RepID=A0A7N0TD33_KALFE
MLDIITKENDEYLTAGLKKDHPHELAYENPVAFPHRLMNFFHPDAEQSGSNKNSCHKSGCSPLSLAVHFESNQAQDRHVTSSQRDGGPEAGAIASIVSGMVFAVLIGM